MPNHPIIPQKAIFHEREGWAYYVANWQDRFSSGARAVLIRLSPRHFARYHRLKEAGRSQKSICYALFKKKPPSVPSPAQAETREATPVPRTGKVIVDIVVLNAEQLIGLIDRHLGVRIVGLRTLAIGDLRKLYLALTHAGNGVAISPSLSRD